mmetsp:Transcript_54740/g.116908  ORF Transcript_54740/g.116908 Transcript_54740/m.116908 type:complete len:231 (+) Transcript_54740:114-806(+)
MCIRFPTLLDLMFTTSARAPLRMHWLRHPRPRRHLLVHRSRRCGARPIHNLRCLGSRRGSCCRNRGRCEVFLLLHRWHRNPGGGGGRGHNAVLVSLVVLFIAFCEASDPWLTQLLGGGREQCSNSILVHHRLVLIRHRVVHHRAVSIAVHVSSKSLMHIAPRDLANLGGGNLPVCKALELVMATLSVVVSDQIHKGVPEGSLRAEVHGHVNKIVLPEKTLAVEHRSEVVA